MKIDDKAIRQLAGLLDETGLTEIEVVEGDQVIRVSKGAGITHPGHHHAAPANNGHPMSADPGTPQQANTETPAVTAADHPGAVVSPMVGTAYLAPEPNTANFVQKGGTVNEGDTLLIIEAMKVMNPIKAHKSGTVTQILAENTQPVEFGAVLMVIE